MFDMEIKNQNTRALTVWIFPSPAPRTAVVVLADRPLIPAW